MELMTGLWLLLVLITAIAVATSVVIYSYKKRQKQSAADEAQRKAIEEQCCEVEQEAGQRAEEEERQRAEAERRRLEKDLLRAEEERHKAEESRKHLEQEKHRMVEEERKHFEEEQSRREGGERERLDEEAQQKAETQRQTEELQKVEEEQRRLEYEAQRKAEELQLAAEEYRRSEQESKRPEETPRREDEAQQKVPEDERLEVEAEGKRLEPGKRGGRPRAPTKAQEKPVAQKTESRRPKPEIICWKKERQWIAAVEIPEELLENSGLAVLQGGLSLTQEESKEACWRLERVFGEVVIQWNESEGVQEIKVALGQDGYLLFKLSDQHQDQGRRVKFPSSGSYLVMVPNDWERDDTLSGPPPVTPECTSLPGYQAHFFELEKDGERKIAFRKPTSEIFKINSEAQQFELVGNRLCDATEKMGPLFGERPPQIRALNGQVWKNVRTIVVGEEGSGKERWRIAFNPVSEQVEQELPLELVARKGGWYFLRFYDTNDELIESLDFRFLCALKEIKMPQPSPLPPEDEHKPVRVEFFHDPGCAVRGVQSFSNIPIEPQNDKTILTIPPDPACDETRWIVGAESGPQVEVTILVERLWWGIGEEHNAPSEWKDQPLTLPREDFAATSNKALWLRLPRRRWVNKVLVGFEQPKARPYDVKVTEKTIAVPLREFGDSKEVRDHTQDHSLKVWIERDGRSTDAIVAIIPASVVPPKPPTAHWVGFGRKKTAVAEAVLRRGSAKIEVNGHPIDEYFKNTPSKAKRFLYRLLELDRVHEVLSQMEVRITVTGSSPSTMRQAKAVAHAIARALMSYDPKLKPLLKQAGFGGVRVKKRPGCNGGSR
jgi:ribosomal protein S9